MATSAGEVFAEAGVTAMAAHERKAPKMPYPSGTMIK